MPDSIARPTHPAKALALSVIRLALPCLLGVAACGGPAGVIPGGVLSGEEAAADSWSQLVSEAGTLDLETRPGDPYSVRIGFFYRTGNVYIDPADGRRWYRNLQDDPSVRVRIADRIYRARAVRVTDPEELEGFDPDRHVHRLELVGGGGR